MKLTDYYEKMDKIENKTDKKGVTWLSLKNDGDTFMGFILADIYNDEQIIQEIHAIKLNGSKFDTRVKCLRGEGGNDNCPICQELNEDRKWKYPPRIKVFLPLYDTETGVSVLWERSHNTMGLILKAVSNYNKLNKSNEYLNTLGLMITRSGKAGDKSTTYIFQVYKLSDEELKIREEKIKEGVRQPIYGNNSTWAVVNNYSYDQLSNFVETKLREESIKSEAPKGYDYPDEFYGDDDSETDLPF